MIIGALMCQQGMPFGRKSLFLLTMKVLRDQNRSYGLVTNTLTCGVIRLASVIGILFSSLYMWRHQRTQSKWQAWAVTKHGAGDVGLSKSKRSQWMNQPQAQSFPLWYTVFCELSPSHHCQGWWARECWGVSLWTSWLLFCRCEIWVLNF